MSGEKNSGASSGRAFQIRRRFARACALQILYQLDVGGDWELGERELELFWKQLEESGEMPPLGEKVDTLKKDVRRLAVGVSENRPKLDELLTTAAANWKLERMNVVDRNILRLGLFEMCWCDNVPTAVAMNEAIELAREYGDKDSPAFVNGLLDKLKPVRTATERETL